MAHEYQEKHNLEASLWDVLVESSTEQKDYQTSRSFGSNSFKSSGGLLNKAEIPKYFTKLSLFVDEFAPIYFIK